MTRRVYIVDDNDSVRLSLHSLLALRPNQIVRGFSSGDLFLAAAGSLRSGVLLLDLHMPGTGGMDVLGALGRDHSGKFATIVLTGAPTTDMAFSALRAGAFDIFEKPYEASILLGAIDTAFSSLASDSTDAARTTTARAKIAGLSKRERDVFTCLVEDHDNDIIGRTLNIDLRAVIHCRSRLLAKLGVGNRSAALRVAFAAGMIPQIRSRSA